MNQLLLNSLPAIKETSGGTYATIARLDGKAAWQFLVMPTQMTWERSANYTPVPAPRFPSQQYKSTDPYTLSITDMPLSTYWNGKSLTNYVASLSNLQLADPDKLSPPVLLWKWGQRLLSPCVLTRFSRTEDSWSQDGEIVSCKISFSLLQVSDRILVS